MEKGGFSHTLFNGLTLPLDMAEDDQRNGVVYEGQLPVGVLCEAHRDR